MVVIWIASILLEARSHPWVTKRWRTVKQMIRNKLIEHKQYINKYGDLPEVRDWTWRY
ncbi:hypothetical protein [Chroogloeocystis siderophila]|uniref:hypothetical protein n=1 Tax=Chroogloeocystis siderophila TaxID=329163 RepID=UPI001C4A6708|nr:hypothetical protein [Chroogloeocystis siderophila]